VPWRCPACKRPVQRGEFESRPRPGATYRCSICRLELRLDETTNKLTVAPLDDSPAPERPRNTR
jgi:hypothetical protein